MCHRTREHLSHQIKSAVKQMNQREGLPFRELIAPEQVEAALQTAGVMFRKRVFDPVVTLWAFLSQVLSADHSCNEAVDRVNAQRAAEGRKAASSETSSYCEARQRLPERVVCDLMRQTARNAEAQADCSWLWKGRHVKIGDGTTATMPDTRENQEAFPQPPTQKAGLGFPMVRLVVIFSLATGLALESAMGKHQGKKTGENTLFREMFHVFNPGDIFLGDRLFDCFRDIAQLKARHVDVVIRMNQSRICDFRRGRRLGQDDHLVIWHKPKFDANRFDRATYEALPASLEMRELRFTVREPGFRPKVIIVVTTLTDPEAYPAEDIAALHRERWHCELDLRSIKSVMQMGHLRCKAPEMVRKEIWMHLLAYNLIRSKMLEAARTYGLLPRQLSFKGAKQSLTQYGPRLATANASCCEHIRSEMLRAMAQRQVGDRPNRSEPREVKKRHSKYSYMTRPRHAKRPQPKKAYA
jgi:hypothetical protein